jgi:Family of unknown function (DUF6850)
MKTSVLSFKLFFLAFACPFLSFGQDEQITIKSYERLLLENLWTHSDNSAGNIFNSFSPDGVFILNSNLQRGDLKLTQLSPEARENSFSAHKMIRFENIVFEGGVSYQNQLQENVGWTGRMDPITDNPYILADSIFGLYNKDYVNLFGSMGYKINDKFSVGARINYLVGDGARIKDPRPVNSKYQIDFYPSLIYSFDKLSLGANLHLMMGREEVSYTSIVHGDIYSFFPLFGLGKSAQTETSWSYYRNYYSSGFGGSIQTEYSKGKMKLFSELGYLKKLEIIEDGSGNPERSKGGDFNESIISYCTILKTESKFIHSAKVYANIVIGEGIEIKEKPEFDTDFSTYYRITSKVSKYSLLKIIPGFTYTLAKPYNNYINIWQLGAGIKMEHLQNDYLLEANQSITNIIPDLNFNYSFFQKKNQWNIGINGLYSLNVNKELIQIRPYIKQEIAVYENITYPDFLFYTSNSLAFGAKIRYIREVKVLKAKVSHVFIDLNAMLRSGSNEAWVNDKTMEFYGVKLGITY